MAQIKSAKVKRSRLFYNEKSLEDFVGLEDEGEREVVRNGKLCIFPSTHVGGHGYMRQKVYDISAISNKARNSEIILRMKRSVYWQETTKNPVTDQRPEYRSEICARVFRGRMRDIHVNVIDKQMFREVAAHYRIIEYQNRGLK